MTPAPAEAARNIRNAMVLRLLLILIPLAARAAVPDPKLWQEYGFENEQTITQNDLTVTAWRFHDSTGALGAILSVPSATARQHYNYVLDFGAHQPTEAEMIGVVSTLKNIDSAPLPSLPGYLPAGPAGKSQRYIIGPVALQRFAPRSRPRLLVFPTARKRRWRSMAIPP